MDNLTNVNFNNGNKPSLHKSRSNFSQAAVTKSDVGDFQEGYFVMADMPPLPQRAKTHKTPERNQRKNEHRQYHTRERSTKDIELLLQRESGSNVSNVRITTSPTRSPPRNKRILNSHSPQRHQQTTYNDSTHTVSISPNKPRKAHSQTNFHEKRFVERSESTPFSIESNSPPKDKGPSPPSTRWAGPAFSNAPPPSSLPIPDFPPFSQSSAAAPSSPVPSKSSPSPSLPGPSFVSHSQYHQPMFIHPPAYVPAAYQGYPLHLGHHEMHSQASLAQLSTDLRRMLNINEQPVQPIFA